MKGSTDFSKKIEGALKKVEYNTKKKKKKRPIF